MEATHVMVERTRFENGGFSRKKREERLSTFFLEPRLTIEVILKMHLRVSLRCWPWLVSH
jgi:hypothetical protein